MLILIWYVTLPAFPILHLQVKIGQRWHSKGVNWTKISNGDNQMYSTIVTLYATWCAPSFPYAKIDADLSLHGCVAPPHRRRRGLRGLDQGTRRRSRCRSRRENQRSCCLLLQDGDQEDIGIKHSSHAADIENCDTV